MALKLSPIGKRVSDFIKSENAISLHRIHRRINNIGANNQAEHCSHAKIIEIICMLKKEKMIECDFNSVIVKNIKLK